MLNGEIIKNNSELPSDNPLLISSVFINELCVGRPIIRHMQTKLSHTSLHTHLCRLTRAYVFQSENFSN